MSDMSKKKRELPPLFWYMEMGDWEKASERVRRHPREVKVWATLRTKSMDDSGSSLASGGAGGGSGRKSSTKRLALHHACFKLRSAGSMPASPKSSDDPFVNACRFIMLLVRLYPDAAGQRESRHGCLPIHLAAFASCAPRSPSELVDADKNKKNNSGSNGSGIGNGGSGSGKNPPGTPSSLLAPPSPNTIATSSTSTTGGTSTPPIGEGNHKGCSKPGMISRRIASDATTGTMETNLSAVHAEETYTGQIMGDKDQRMQFHQQMQKQAAVAAAKHAGNSHSNGGGFGNAGCGSGGGGISSGTGMSSGIFSMARSHSSVYIPPKREEMAVQVINALLDAYPKGIRVDSEGGRLPLHTACAGRATPRVVSTLVTAYPSAARHRNKDGFLPLHLAAHWGVSHPSVAVTLLKAYPDATVGRNRWERTPLEEALVMAGENGRPHQPALVRALRKHPNYWSHPLPLSESTDYRKSSAPVDIDESLPSNESSNEEAERQRYLQYGQHASVLVSPEDEREARESRLRLAASKAHSAEPGLLNKLRNLSTTSSPTRGKKADEEDDDAVAMAFPLETLIQNRRWKTVIARLKYHPLEAEQDLAVVTRGGFNAVSGFTPLHYACERQPPVEVVRALIEHHPAAVTTRTMPGGAVPLHVACTWYGDAQAVHALVMADPTSANIPDELGNLALHSACFSGADVDVVECLLDVNGKACLTRNHQGSRPMDICKRLRHENRRPVMALLTLQKEEIMAQHRRTQSSGTWSDAASIAAELNERSERSNNSKNDNGFRETDDLQEQAGVEVSYNEDGSRELLWI